MAGQQRLSTQALPERSSFLFGFTDGPSDKERLRLELYLQNGERLFRYDQMIVQQVSDMDVEKVQFEISSHGLIKGLFFNRNVKAVSISAVLTDLVQDEVDQESLVVHDQLSLFEYLYRRYFRASQVARHKYQLEMTVRGHTYIGLMANAIFGLASDDDTIGAVSFTYLVLDEQLEIPETPEVFAGDTSAGPATFSRETAEELEHEGDIPQGEVPSSRRSARGSLGQIIDSRSESF